MPRQYDDVSVLLAAQSRWNYDILPGIKLLLATLGLFQMVKQIYRRRRI